MNTGAKSVYVFIEKYQNAHMAADEVANRKRYRVEPPGPRPCNLNRLRKDTKNVGTSP